MKSILTRHLLAFSNSLAHARRFSSEAGTKWFAASMVTVRVAAYSGGVFVSMIPARPAVAPAAVLRTRRRLNPVCDVLVFCIDVFLSVFHPLAEVEGSLTALCLLGVNPAQLTLSPGHRVLEG